MKIERTSNMVKYVGRIRSELQHCPASSTNLNGLEELGDK